ncbi:hypothetical protein BHE97_19230 [Aeromicrobium sp. PE09-221]|nr:hypothetical protein BHE97_19230 [Aeromicrobium sp. PE09-221]
MWWIAAGWPLLLVAVLMASGLLPRDAAERLRDRGSRFGWVAVVPAGILCATAGSETVTVPWMLFGTSVALDAIARPLLAMAVVLYGLALAFIPRSGTERPALLSGLVMVCFVANAGVFAAADLITFYLCFTVMSFAGYGLVVHSGSRPARRAGRIYLVMTVLGEGAVLSAMVLIARAGGLRLGESAAAVAGSPDRDLIIGLLLLGFGVKAGTVPLHVWLPLAHPAAPTPASAVLSGAMIKAGLVGWLRFLPFGESEIGWGTAFMALALLGGFLAVPAGLLQDDPKVVLAYSSISQMGFLAVLIGVALAVPEAAGACTIAAVVYAVHHGLAKGVLFLGVQMWDVERWRRWPVAVLMAVAGLSIIGAPLTGGYVAKYGAKEAVGAAMFPATGGASLAEVLPWVGLGSTLLLARFAVVMWRRDRAPSPTPITRDIAWAIVAVAPVGAVGWLASSHEPLSTTPDWFDPGTWVAQSWPLLVGLVLAVGAARIARGPRWKDSRIAHPHGDIVPPGDVVTLEERLVSRAGVGLRAALHRLEGLATDIRARLTPPVSLVAAVARAQRSFSAWEVSGTVLLVLIAAALGWAAVNGGGA